MDQKSLCEFQVGEGGSLSVDNSPALLGRDRYILEDIADRYGMDRVIHVAELSIGEGRLTESMLRHFRRVRLNCVDISETRIEYVQRRLESCRDLGLSRVRFTECNFDTEFGTIEAAAYDIVIAMDIMEHVLDVFGFVEHCRRILVRGGILYIRVPNIAYIKHRLGLLLGELPVTASWFGSKGDLHMWRTRFSWDGGHLHLFTIPVLVKLLNESYFSVVKISDPGTFALALRKLWPNLFFSNPLIIARGGCDS